jgi:hypothetical protein
MIDKLQEIINCSNQVQTVITIVETIKVKRYDEVCSAIDIIWLMLLVLTLRQRFPM